jgi:long-chain acyl-CoA synthetase
MATVDDEGYYTIVDRKKDMILRGGMNVYPREVEELIYTHPDVLEVAVVAVPDELLGENVGAAIVLRPGVTTSVEDDPGVDQGADRGLQIPANRLAGRGTPQGSHGQDLAPRGPPPDGLITRSRGPPAPPRHRRAGR